MFRKFVNREDELRFLKGEYQKEEFSFVVVYGRRRVGKTELTMMSSKDLPVIYFLADKRGTKSNFFRLRKKVADFFDDYEPAVETFDELFRYMAEKWKGKKKLIVIIDEFSYLVEKDPSIPSVFQLIVDETLSKASFHLILCGSSVSMMEKGVLSYKSPLYGRRTGQINLRPLAFRELKKFFPGLDIEDRLKIYGAFGGIPFYLSFIDKEKSFVENLEGTVFNDKNILYAEGEFLLKEELKDPSTYMGILTAIAQGATKAGEIANKSFLEVKDLPYFLQILKNLGLIEKEIPVTEKRSSKKSIYKISDPFLRFWFTFVFPNRGMIETREGMATHIISNYDEYMGHAFEEVAEELLKDLNGRGKLPFEFEIVGRQWGKIPYKPRGENEYEIDLVALNKKEKKILFCECKWQEDVDSVAVLKGLKEKSKAVKWPNGGRRDYFCVIAKSFKTWAEGALLLSLGDFE
ncbi:MAG: ATP-binding protein [Candidatus Hydrothermarchaeaceae archaeon]